MALRYIRKRPRSLKSTPASQNQNLWIGRPLKKVETFVYLGSTIARQGGTDADVIARIGKATASFIQPKIIGSSKEIRGEDQDQTVLLQCQVSPLVWSRNLEADPPNTSRR